jgi:tetratricopeptide (TPR) repeat protein
MGDSSIDQLKEMVELYPYASIFQLLLAKALHNVGDLSLDEKLRKAAIVTSERSVLYNLLYANRIKEIIEKVEQDIAEPFIHEEVEEVFVAKEVEQEEPSLEFVKEEQSKVEDELQQDILLEAITSSLQFDVDELLKEDRLKSVQEVKEETQEVVKEEVTEAFATPLKFSDWLLTMKSKDAAEVSKEEVKQPLKSTKDLIDNFIAVKNKRINISNEPLTPQEQGKLSLVDNEDFVTETLANIYAKQGKYSKAIKIYQQLILNFPEKSTFFASRIRFLREKMEYDNN